MISFCFSEEYLIGGKKGWSDVDKKYGVTEGRGRFGYTSMQLETNQFSKDEFTDLLIDFEDNTIVERTGNYSVSKNDLFLSENAKFGKQSALSRNLGTGLQLKGEKNSIFGRTGPVGSFCIEFWICPSLVENGEILFNWRSSQNLNDNVIYQMIRVNIYQNKIYCLMSNIFYGYTENNGDIELHGITDLIPGKWSHHILSYDEETGLLEYRISKVSYYYYFDRLADNASHIEKTLYSPDGGVFTTKPILFKPGTILNSIKAEIFTPEQTEVNLYVRAGDTFYGWNKDFPEWKQVSNNEKITGISGRYIQIASQLLPDGGGTDSPVLTEIVLDYTELPAPLPPFKVSAKKGDGSVTLEWNNSLDETSGGYYIYYGTKPGEYLGRIANEGASPVDAGNTTFFTLTGLKNGTIYYFAISTYSKLDSRITGELSKEVYARPSAK